MKKILPVVSVILLINLIFGYLFQVSNEIVCFTELGLLGIGGLVFWLSFYKPLQRVTTSVLEKGGLITPNLLKIGGLGIAIGILNLFFCQLFLVVTMFTLFGCESPAFQLLNASLTNSFAGNILCYSFLVFFIINERSGMVRKKLDLAKEDYQALNKITGPVIPPAALPKSSKDYFLLADSKKTTVKVATATISHLTVQSNCIFIHSEDRKFVKYQSLKSFHEALPQDQFIRIHRSTVVNLHFIESITNQASGDGEVYLKNGVRLRYSRNYKKALRPFLLKS